MARAVVFGAAVLVFFVFLLATAAAQVQITPSVIDFKAKVNEQKSFNLTITNNFNFKVTNFRFSNLSAFTFPQIMLEPFEAKTVTVTGKLTEAQIKSISSVVSFNYLVSVPSQPKTHYVNITGGGFSPTFLVVHQDDTVIWKNLDDISHTVTSATFDFLVPANGTATKVFNTVGSIDYQDIILFGAGTVTVLNRTAPQEVTNPLYNQALTVNVEVASDPTTLIVAAQPGSFTVPATSSKEGSLSVRNAGTSKADRIKLTAEPNWVKFGENEFDVEPGDTNFVTFNVSLFLLNASETNKTYNLTLRIKGINTPEYTVPLSIFVPYSNFSADFSTHEGSLLFYQQFCSQPGNRNLLICNNTVLQGGGQERVIVRDPQIQFNGSLFTVAEIAKRMQRIEDSNQRTDNKLKEVADQFGVTVPQLFDMLNQTIQQQQAIDRRSRQNWITFWLIVPFVVFCSGCVVVMIVWNRYRQRQNALRGIVT